MQTAQSLSLATSWNVSLKTTGFAVFHADFSKRTKWGETHLCKFVYLFNHCSKQSTYALINQTLHIMHRLLVWEVQSKLVLNLQWAGKEWTPGFTSDVLETKCEDHTYLFYGFVRLQCNVWNICIHHQREQIQNEIWVSAYEERKKVWILWFSPRKYCIKEVHYDWKVWGQ